MSLQEQGVGTGAGTGVGTGEGTGTGTGTGTVIISLAMKVGKHSIPRRRFNVPGMAGMAGELAEDLEGLQTQLPDLAYDAEPLPLPTGPSRLLATL
jgi:penicillin amidase